MRETDAAYIAGVFDGEGNLGLTPNLLIKVQISQKRRDRLEAIRGVLGYGTIYDQTNASILVIQRRDLVRDFIRRVYPYSLWRQEHLRIAYAVTCCSAERMDRRRELGERLRVREYKARVGAGIRLAPEDREAILRRLSDGETTARLAAEYGVTRGWIGWIRRENARVEVTS